MTYVEDGTAAKKLLDALGLPLTTPVVEWHRYVPGEDTSPPPGGGGTDTVTRVATLTVAAGKVTGSLSGLVVRIDLSTMPAAWWAAVDATGAGIRVRKGGTLMPRDLNKFDKGTSTGELYARLDSLTGGDTIEVLTTDGAAPAHTDPLGRHATWADFEAVFLFTSSDNRTGKAGALTLGNGATLTADGRLFTGGASNRYAKVTGLPKLSTWVMAATHSPSGTTGQDGILSYSSNDSNNGNRMTWLRSGGGIVQLWNSSQTWSGGRAQSQGRGWALQTPTTRQLYLGDPGGAAASVASGGSSARPGGAGDTLWLMAEDADLGEVYQGYLDRVYLRDGTLSADYIKAEHESWENTASFYASVTDSAGDPPPDPDPEPSGWVLDEDRTAALVDYTARHGRSSPLDNVAPLQGSATLARSLLTDPIPTVGERYRLTLNADVATALGVSEDERPRFTGEITDVDVDPNGDRTIVSVTGVGRAARLGRIPVAHFRRGTDLDGRRVQILLRQAQRYLDYELGTIDPGTVELMAIEEESQNVRALIDQVVTDSLGQLVEHRSGRLEWHDAEHRRDLASAVTLTGSSHLIRPFKWSQAIATVVNIAEVIYGADRDSITVQDPASADPDTGLGPYGVTLDTQLADRDAAHSLGSTVVGRYATPAWMLPDVLVDVVRSSGAEAGEVLALTHGDKVTASGLPADGPFTAGDLFVEGTTETFTRTAWRVSLSVADPAIAGAGLRWLDIPATETWADIDPTLTWLDLATAAPEDL